MRISCPRLTPVAAKLLSQFQHRPGLAGGPRAVHLRRYGASRGDFMHALDTDIGYPNRSLANIVLPDGLILRFLIGLSAVMCPDQK
jgi:hypothetical protein